MCCIDNKKKKWIQIFRFLRIKAKFEKFPMWVKFVENAVNQLYQDLNIIMAKNWVKVVELLGTVTFLQNSTNASTLFDEVLMSIFVWLPMCSRLQSVRLICGRLGVRIPAATVRKSKSKVVASHYKRIPRVTVGVAL